MGFKYVFIRFGGLAPGDLLLQLLPSHQGQDYPR